MTYPFVHSAVDLGRARGPRLAFVVHMAEGGGTVGYLSRPNPNGVSVHFVIERSGRTVQMLAFDRMHSSIRASAIRTTNDSDGFYGASAARAVMGAWADVRKTLGPNHASIAVEIEGFAKDGPNPAQTQALKALYADLAKRYPGIRSLGHRDFASYKACPGKRIPWGLIGGHGTSKPAEPAKEEPVGNPLVAAAKKQLDYYENELSSDRPKAQGHAVRALGYVGRLIEAAAPKAAEAAGGLFSWADARAGKVDLSEASNDTYGTLIQTVAVRLGWHPGPLPFSDQADQLITVILGHGERYYPSSVYPVIPDDVLEAVMGTSDPSELEAAIEPYRAKLRAAGAPIEDRPETA